jgi:LSD1 subclass zinc finger protein
MALFHPSSLILHPFAFAFRFTKLLSLSLYFSTLRRPGGIARMKVTQEFVDTMICPACRSKLRLKEDATAIKCLGCRRVYPVEGEIIVMLPEKATIEDEDPSPSPA